MFRLNRALAAMLVLAIPASLLGTHAILAREFAASEENAHAVARSFETREQLRPLAADLDATEGDQLEARTEASNRARTTLQRTALALNAALIALLGLTGFIIARTLRSRSNALRAAEDHASRQAAVFDGAKDAMITINPSGSIETLNPAAAALFGYAPDALMRRDVGMLFEVAPDRGRVETFLKRLQARRTLNASKAEGFWARRQYGSTFLAEVTVNPVPLADGASPRRR